jgi:hypothetical protein
MYNPREALSWNQLLTWQKGEQVYYETYFLGKRQKFKYEKNMDFGKKIATGLEQKKTNDEDVEFCRDCLPKPKYKEKILIADFEGVILLAKPDGCYLKKEIRVDEYKTGKQKWTQKMADNLGQITLYDMVIYKLTGKIPRNFLYYFQTKEEGGEIYLVRKPPSVFETKRTMKDFMLLYPILKKAQIEINNFCKKI